jgi:hypothetical protein
MTRTPAVGWVTSGYGKRTPPRKTDGTYGTAFHVGVDIGGPAGSPVVAPEAGRVTAVTSTSLRGLYVVVDHGRYRTLHQHLATSVVAEGQWVAEGQRIGVMGTSGGVARHLHTEVHDGTTPINPTTWYAERGVTLGVGMQVLGLSSTAVTTDTEKENEMFIVRVNAGKEKGHTFLVDLGAGVCRRFPDTTTRQAVAEAGKFDERSVDQAGLDHIRFMARLVLEARTGRHEQSAIFEDGTVGFLKP